MQVPGPHGFGIQSLFSGSESRRNRAEGGEPAAAGDEAAAAAAASFSQVLPEKPAAHLHSNVPTPASKQQVKNSTEKQHKNIKQTGKQKTTSSNHR